MSLSIVINFHREGELALPTLRSVFESLEVLLDSHSGAGFLDCEVIAVFDKSDYVTRAFVRQMLETQCPVNFSVFQTNIGDLGESRNLGIDNASKQFVILADGDDLVSKNYFPTFYETINSSISESFFHPAKIHAFGQSPHIFQVAPSAQVGAVPQLVRHYFGSRIAGRRELFQKIRYRKRNELGSTLFEDWDFAIRAQMEGCDIQIVPGTTIYYRTSPDTIMGRANSDNLVSRLDTSGYNEEKFLRWISDNPAPKEIGPEVMPHQRDKDLDWAISLEPKIDPNPNVNFKHPLKRDLKIGLSLIKTYLGVLESGRLVIADEPGEGGGEKHIRFADKLLGSSPSALFLGNLEHYFLKGGAENSQYQVEVESGTFSIIDRLDFGLRLLALLSASMVVIYIKPGTESHKLLSQHRKPSSAKTVAIYFSWFDGSSLGHKDAGFRHFFLSGLGNALEVCDFIFTDSRWYSEFIRLNVDAAPDRVLAVDIPEPLSVTSGYSPVSRQFLWVGRLAVQKRPELLDAIGTLISKKRGRVDFYSSTKKREISRKFFVNPGLRYQGIADSLSDAKEKSRPLALIYTSLYDGIPNVILEAFASGLPVFAPDIFPINRLFSSLGLENFLVPISGDVLEDAKSYYIKLKEISDLDLQAWISLSTKISQASSQRNSEVESLNLEVVRVIEGRITSDLSPRKPIDIRKIRRDLHLVEHSGSDEIFGHSEGHTSQNQSRLLEVARRLFKDIELLAYRHRKSPIVKVAIATLRKPYHSLAKILENYANRGDR